MFVLSSQLMQPITVLHRVKVKKQPDTFVSIHVEGSWDKTTEKGADSQGQTQVSEAVRVSIPTEEVFPISTGDYIVPGAVEAVSEEEARQAVKDNGGATVTHWRDLTGSYGTLAGFTRFASIVYIEGK